MNQEAPNSAPPLIDDFTVYPVGDTEFNVDVKIHKDHQNHVVTEESYLLYQQTPGGPWVQFGDQDLCEGPVQGDYLTLSLPNNQECPTNATPVKAQVAVWSMLPLSGEQVIPANGGGE